MNMAVTTPLVERKPRALLFDLDGCVVDSAERATRINYGAKRSGDFETYYRSLAYDYSISSDGDKPIASGLEVVNALRIGLGVERAFATTMRGEESRTMTLGWLASHLPFEFSSDDLYMSKGRWADENGNYYQPNEKYLSSVDHKREVARKLQEDYEIVIAVDDHPDICVMYREIGIPALMMLHPSVDCLSPVGDRTLLTSQN